ncbi:MAG: recombination mediator RecR [Saprospiraceae bacterium]
MKYSSQLLQNAVDAFSSLPGIGKKTALRLALHVLYQDNQKVSKFCEAIEKFNQNIRRCPNCNYISDEDQCSLCNDQSRKKEAICIVESIRDVMAIEDTGQYHGQYHVLGALISPIEGIGPDTLFISNLPDRIQSEGIQEVIMAISPTIEGETTIFYLSRYLSDLNVKISQIARGVSFGGDLEYADEVTLGRSILSRVPYQIAE